MEVLSLLHWGWAAQNFVELEELTQNVQRILFHFRCANHSVKPLKAKIIFSNGFNDFWVFSPLHNNWNWNKILCTFCWFFPDLYVLAFVQCNKQKAVALAHWAVLLWHHNVVCFPQFQQLKSYASLFSGNWARMMALNIRMHPAISRILSFWPNITQPPRTENTDSRLRIRDATVGSASFCATIWRV